MKEVNYRPTVYNIDQMQEALSLGMQAQNAAVGTCFIKFYGHNCNELTVDVHCPEWQPDASPTHRFELSGHIGARAANEHVLSLFREFLIAEQRDSKSEKEVSNG